MSRKTEQESTEDRISRLETVVSFIREYGNLGSVDDPAEFIEDTQTMWYGEPWIKLVYFTGKTERTECVLGGSLGHVIGANVQEKGHPSHSALNALGGWLRSQEKGDGIGDPLQPLIFHSICHLVERNERLNLPKQRLEFFAKQLLFEPEYFDFEPRISDREGSVQVLLATPLYIAMTD